MKKRFYIVAGGAIIAVAGIVMLTKEAAPSPQTQPAPVTKTGNTTEPPLVRRQLTAETLASMGTLWEPGAPAREASRTSIPIEDQAFAPLENVVVGQRVSLNLSNRVKPLEATVTSVAVQEDGTSVVHLRVEGEPVGQLIVQENKEADFFIAQLYYEDLPLAYDFKRSSGTLIAERRLVSDLVCSFVDGNVVAERGLPVAEEAKKPKVTKAATVSVSSPKVLEGDAGTQSLVFVLTLPSKVKNGVTFSYSVAGNTATAGTDFTAKTGTVTIKTTGTVVIPVISDTELEPDETVTLTVTNPGYTTATATGTIVNDDTATTTPPPPTTSGGLNSLPEASACIYLDFDGQVVTGTAWANGGTVNAAASGFSATQIEEVWKRVSEDYAPFKVNVTTDAAVFAAAAPNRRIRCIITPSNEWYGKYGGVAYVSSFTWTGDTPCWVFSDVLSNSSRFVADAASHEVGHTLGLSHDGTSSVGYYEGHGSGLTGWAPIMGSGYYEPLVQWSKGEYSGANNKQDDLAIISGQNGFTYRADDHGNTPIDATALTGNSPAASGIITTRDDIDEFSFTTRGGTVSFNLKTAAPSGNLDIEVRLVNSAGTVVATANPSAALDASISTSVPAGTYYLVVDGVGFGTATTGYTDYGSLGAYSITGTVP